jgi:hypothetical protein
MPHNFYVSVDVAVDISKTELLSGFTGESQLDGCTTGSWGKVQYLLLPANVLHLKIILVTIHWKTCQQKPGNSQSLTYQNLSVTCVCIMRLH